MTNKVFLTRTVICKETKENSPYTIKESVSLFFLFERKRKLNFSYMI